MAMPVAAVVVQRAAAVDLEAHQVDERRRAATLGEVDLEALEVVLGQVLAAAVEVLVDVAQEVGQLERLAEGAGRARGRRPGPRGSRIGSIISPITAAEPSM